MIYLSKFFKEQQWNQILVVILLLFLLALGALPGYITGRWLWKQPPPVIHLKELKHIRNVGLNLPGWQTLEQSQTLIGEHKWSFQLIKKEDSLTQAIILLLPQNGPRDQPEIEWTEINGWAKSRWRKWDIAQDIPREFTVKQTPKSGYNTTIKINARFFRAVTQTETFAVLQWYAMPNGGSLSPFPWFVADQLAQWHQQRVSWVAVSIMIPMEPLGKVETSWSLARSLGETVQSTLFSNL